FQTAGRREQQRELPVREKLRHLVARTAPEPDRLLEFLHRTVDVSHREPDAATYPARVGLRPGVTVTRGEIDGAIRVRDRAFELAAHAFDARNAAPAEGLALAVACDLRHLERARERLPSLG